jgi:hypothetical protein
MVKSTCLADMRPWVQTPVLPRKQTKKGPLVQKQRKK